MTLLNIKKGIYSTFKKKKEESIRVLISSTRMAPHSYVKKQ